MRTMLAVYEHKDFHTDRKCEFGVFECVHMAGVDMQKFVP